MSHSCAQWRGDMGAYIVDALDGPARSRITRHLAGCPGCRADYEELAPVRDWLDVLAPPARQRPGTQVPAQPAGKQPAARRGARRWLPAAGATLLAVVAATVAVLASPGTPARTFRAVDRATGVSGYAQLHGTATGTQISLTASGLPRSERCILVAVSRDGSDIAGSWAAAYDGSARIAGTTAIHADRLTALRIESDTGVLLLRIRM